MAAEGKGDPWDGSGKQEGCVGDMHQHWVSLSGLRTGEDQVSWWRLSVTPYFIRGDGASLFRYDNSGSSFGYSYIAVTFRYSDVMPYYTHSDVKFSFRYGGVTASQLRCVICDIREPKDHKLQIYIHQRKDKSFQLFQLQQMNDTIIYIYIRVQGATTRQAGPAGLGSKTCWNTQK